MEVKLLKDMVRVTCASGKQKTTLLSVTDKSGKQLIQMLGARMHTAELWYSFSENATCGYVCLLSLLGLTDVLHGILQESPPIIPPRVVSQAVSRDTMNWPADVSCVLQQNLSFYHVWNWPIGFGSVEVMNLALVTAFQPVQKSVPMRGCKKLTKSKSKPVFSCDFSAPVFHTHGEMIRESMSQLRVVQHKVKRDVAKKVTFATSLDVPGVQCGHIQH